MQRVLTLATGFSLAVLTALTAQAQDRPKRKAAQRLDAAFFDRMDTNKDGTVTLDEIPEDRRDRAKQLFDRLDSDKDGKLTRREFQSGLDRARPKSEPPEKGKSTSRPDTPPPVERRPDEARRPAEIQPPPGRPPFDGESGRPPFAFGGPDLFRALDSDNDQKLSKVELAKAVESIMKHDKNGDGFVTPEELAEALRGSRFGQNQPGAPDAPRPPGAPVAAPPGAPSEEARARVAAIIKRADKNGDGKLNQDESPELLRGRFNEIDANTDGFIDATELAQVALNPRRPEEGPPGGPFAPGGPLFPGRPGAGAPDRPVNESNIAANRERIAAMLRERDKDADGRISSSEFGADRAEEFKRLDSNNDGYLTPDELARGLAPRADRPEGRRPAERAKEPSEGKPATEKP